MTYKIPVRNVVTTDEHPAPGLTVRRAVEDGVPLPVVLFVGGWRRGTYKTEAGLARAVARYTAEGAESAARYAAVTAARENTVNFTVVEADGGYAVESAGLDGRAAGIVSRTYPERVHALSFANKWNRNLGFAATT